MHYGPYEGARDNQNPALVDKAGNPIKTQRLKPSVSDYDGINAKYPCSWL